MTLLQKLFGTKSSDREHYDAFISYRRETGSDLASLLKIRLESKFRKRIFLDVKELQVGRFDEALLQRIEQTPNFILILSKDALERCTLKTDWLKREIMQALKTGRNIIPVMTDNFSFPLEEVWKNLPSEMQELQSLNGIHYNHLYQDPAIEMINAFMKAEVSHYHIPKASPIPAHPVTDMPPAPRDTPTKPHEPVTQGDPNTTTGNSTSAGSSNIPEGEKPLISLDPNNLGSKGNATQPVPGKPVDIHVHESPKPIAQIELTTEPYTVITGVLVKKIDGEEIKLPEFGSRAEMTGKPVRDFFKIERGGGFMNIPWNKIDSVVIHKWDDIIIFFCDGKSIDHVKSGFGSLIGIDEMGFNFNIPFDKMQSITLLRDKSFDEEDALMRDIPILAKKNTPNASYSSEFKFERDSYGILVTHDLMFQKKLATNGHSTFRFPGSHTFTASGVSIVVNIEDYGFFNLAVSDGGTAQALAHALNRLNSLMYMKYGNSCLQE
jgi:hypothetical protein